MVGRTSDWKEELGRFLKPFLDRLGHKARRQMCPLYVSGLIGPGDRKSIQPMAERQRCGSAEEQPQACWTYFLLTSGLTTWRAQSMKSPANGLSVRFFTMMIPTAVR
jgi:SRSO17 transposase